MKRFLITLVLIVLGFTLFADPVSQLSAQKAAVNFFKHYVSNKADYTVSDVMVKQLDGVNTFYIFQFAAGGFIFVSADDAAIPVLGYSEDGFYNESSLPPAMAAWLNDYSRQIKNIVDNNLDNAQTVQEWNKVKNNLLPATKLVVNPLCTTTWDQGCYYNTSCPSASGGDCGHVWTGCIATAMAQVMKKWNYPTTGIGTHTYTPSGYPVQTANYGSTTYQWASMPNSVTSTNNAVATLMWHCGVGVNMQYGTSGSGAYTWDVPNALKSYFGYDNSAEIMFKDDFSSTDWINLLKADLDAGRPVLYSGDNGSAGHAFVFDGYNSSNQFHVNWGWSGYYNNYFAVGSLNPNGDNFNSGNAAVIRIHPPSTTIPIADFTASTTTPAVGGQVTFTDNSSNSPTTWTWTFNGGSPSTFTGQTPPAITYSTAGYYLVALTVSNSYGSDTKTKVAYINVGGTPSAWIKQNSGFTTASRGIDQIFIVNPYLVWAKAYDGTSTTNVIREFTKTNNGGITWTPGTITFTNSTNYGVSNIFAFSDTVCYACMYPITATGGAIVKTNNGGTTWTVQSTAPFTNSWANFVHFFNTNEGVCVGDPTGSGADYVIYTTANGGTTWTQVAGANITNAQGLEAGIANQYDAVGDNIWFGTTYGRIYRSTNKGANWTAYNVLTSPTASRSVTPVFKDANNGIAIIGNYSTGAYMSLYKTVNGGTSWTVMTPTGFYLKYPHIDYVPGTTNTWVDVTAGPGKGSSYSTNFCSSFLNIDTGSVQYTSVTFYDINTGWAGGFNASASDGGIYKWQNLIITGSDEVSAGSSDVHIYPNPTTGLINIEFSVFASEKAFINVYNMAGQKVQSEEFDPSFNNLLQIDLSKHNPGVYMVSVQTGSEIITRRVLLQ